MSITEGILEETSIIYWLIARYYKTTFKCKISNKVTSLLVMHWWRTLHWYSSMISRRSVISQAIIHHTFDWLKSVDRSYHRIRKETATQTSLITTVSCKSKNGKHLKQLPAEDKFIPESDGGTCLRTLKPHPWLRLSIQKCMCVTKVSLNATLYC